MEKRFVYADNAATTRISQTALDAAMPYLREQFGNASAVYSLGRKSREAILIARQQAAKAIGAEVYEIYFTSGGTEADNWAINACAQLGEAKNKKHIITSSIEHYAVLESCKALERQGYEITYLPVSPDGFVSVSDLEAALREDTCLVSIMAANNEIGTIQPIADIGKLCREKDVLFHTDAVQAMGNIPLDVKAMNIDLLSVSGHKIHAPKGVGCLYCSKSIDLPSFIKGGHQERGKRAGTENTAFIAAFGEAMEQASKGISERAAYVKKLRDRLLDGLSGIERMSINGSLDNRLPGNVNLSFDGIEGEGLIIVLDMQGICVSSGAACASGSLEPSHVLLALGKSEKQAQGSVRITLNEENTEEDVDCISHKLKEAVEHLRSVSPLWDNG